MPALRSPKAQQGVPSGRASGHQRTISNRQTAIWLISIVLAFVVLWDLLTRLELVSPILLAPPSDVAAAFIELCQAGYFWQHVATTAREIAVGWAIAVASGIAVAWVSVRFRVVRRALFPYIIVIQALPKVVLLPIMTVAFGLGTGSTIALIVISGFFPTFLNTFVGLTSTDGGALKLLDSLGASSGQVLRYLRLPQALPLIMTGVQGSATIACLAAIIGEFAGARFGLGYLINANAFSLRVDYVYAAIFATSILSLVFFGAVTLLRKRLVTWE